MKNSKNTGHKTTVECNSISQTELEIDESISTAIIYAIPDLFKYNVEIRYLDKSEFVKDGDGSISQFDNIENAKKRAYKLNAKKIYLAFNIVYDETGINIGNPNKIKYDYQLIN